MSKNVKYSTVNTYWQSDPGLQYPQSCFIIEGTLKLVTFSTNSTCFPNIAATALFSDENGSALGRVYNVLTFKSQLLLGTQTGT